MVNAWRAHVKKTMEEMKKSAPKGVTVMLKDVLKKAKSTYKKIDKIEDKKHYNKTAKKHNSKRKGKKKANRTITISILKPIPSGLTKENFIHILEKNIYSELDLIN